MPKLTLTLNNIFQAVATIAQLGNQYIDAVPPKYKLLATGILAVLQWIVATKAHSVDTAGVALPPVK